jgi:hypothetical protein
VASPTDQPSLPEISNLIGQEHAPEDGVPAEALSAIRLISSHVLNSLSKDKESGKILLGPHLNDAIQILSVFSNPLESRLPMEFLKTYKTMLPKLERLINYKDIERLSRIIDYLTSDKLLWAKVESVKAGPEVNVYDIEVPKSRSFIADGYLVHNSISVSQLVSYTTHQFLMLRNPALYFGLLQNTILHGNVVALTYSQAKVVVLSKPLALRE